MSAKRNRSPIGAVMTHFVFVGFYALAVLVALALVASPLIEWMVLGRIHVQILALVAVGAALFLVLMPSPEHFDPPGPEIDATDQPELFDVLEKVVSVMRSARPVAVYLSDEMNLYLAHVGGFLGLGGHRVLVIGAPLMSVLDPEEFGAVVAHELGHLDHRDGRVAPMVYLTRTWILGQLAAAKGSLVRAPFAAGARLYLRATARIARRQELTADAVAAAATSRRAMAEALALLPFGTVAFDVYLRNEYLPVLASGRQPPLLGGFDAFLTSEVARDHLALDPRAALGATAGTSHDCHPPVPERLVALGATAVDFRDRPLPEVRSTALLRDVDAIETELCTGRLDPGVTPQPITWSMVGIDVLVPRWQEERRSLLGELPAGFHLGALPLDLDGLAELGTDVARHRQVELDRAERESYGHRAARAIIGEAAFEAGLAVEMAPGEPVWFGRPPDQFGLFSAYDDVIEGRAEPHVWFELLAEAGLSRPVPSAVADPSTTPPPAVASRAVASPPAPARAPVAPRPAAPARASLDLATVPAGVLLDFDVPVGMGRHQRLVIDGEAITWRGTTVGAADVVGVAYVTGDVLEARLWTPDRDVAIKMTANGRNRDASAPAWESIVRWVELHVASRLVDGHLARLAERGRITVGDLVLTTNGVVVKGRVVPWSVLAHTRNDGRAVVVTQRDAGRDTYTDLISVDVHHADVVLLPAIITAATAASTLPSDPPG